MLSVGIERHLTDLICAEINLHLRIEQQKIGLVFSPGFSIRRCFKAIDERALSYIDERSLRRFFKKVGHRPNKEELIAIIRRIDSTGDNIISYEEFCEGLQPL